MRFGLALPHYDFSLAGGEPISFESTARFAHMAERFEFDSAWVSDHFFLSLARYGGPPDLQGTLEAVSAVDLFSGGRLDLGSGAGWYDEEFRGFGYGFGTVGERFAVREDTR